MFAPARNSLVDKRWGEAVPGSTDRFIIEAGNGCEVDDMNIGHNKVEYSYDALGRRIERRVEKGDTTIKTRFNHDGARVAEEWDIPETGLPTFSATYVYGNYIDEVLTMNRDGVNYYYHGDDMHNVGNRPVKYIFRFSLF